MSSELQVYHQKTFILFKNIIFFILKVTQNRSYISPQDTSKKGKEKEGTFLMVNGNYYPS
jgi:hypothetical protein